MPNGDLNGTFAALAHPVRRAIVDRLSSGEATVTELAEPFEISLPAVSRHLSVLERTGLIVRGREAQFRPCRLATEPLRELSEWLDAHRRLWDDRLDRLEDHFRERQTGCCGIRPSPGGGQPSEWATGGGRSG